MNLYVSYKISIEKKSQKFLDNLDVIERTILVEKIKKLNAPIALLDIKKLKGYQDLYRLSVNDFRVVFYVDKKQKRLMIILIGYRKDIYERLKRAVL
jgi:mRNA interferase RelE/StbE